MLGVTCNGLASHPGGVAFFLVALCYRNWRSADTPVNVLAHTTFHFTEREPLTVNFPQDEAVNVILLATWIMHCCILCACIRFPSSCLNISLCLYCRLHSSILWIRPQLDILLEQWSVLKHRHSWQNWTCKTDYLVSRLSLNCIKWA